MNRDEILDKIKEILDSLKDFPKGDDYYCFKCNKLQCSDDEHADYWIYLKPVSDFLNQVDNIEDLK